MVCADGKFFNFHLLNLSKNAPIYTDLAPKMNPLQLDSNRTNQIEVEVL